MSFKRASSNFMAVSQLTGSLQHIALKITPFLFPFKRLFATSAYFNLLEEASPQSNLERTLDHIKPKIDSSSVESVLQKPSIDRIMALRFFIWAGQLSYYRHSPLMYSKASESLEIPRLPETLIHVLETYKKEKIRVSIKTFKVILNICREAKLAELSLQILRKMKEFNCRPDTVSYNVVIRLFCHNNEIEVAIALMEEMAMMGLFPDLITYVAVIKGLCEFGRLDEARQVFNEMRNRGCSPNKVAYSALIDGACRAGSLDVAMELLGAMEKEGFSSGPNVVTYTALIQSMCEKGEMIEAIELLDRMSQHGCEPNWVTVNTLINRLIAEGHVKEAYGVADRVSGNGTLSSDKCYSYVVVGLIRVKNVDEAENVVKKMLANGVRPTGLATSSLIKELCSIRRSLDGFTWCMELIKKDGELALDSDLHLVLLAALCREGHLQEAKTLIDDMEERRILGRNPYVVDVVDQLKNAGEEELALRLMRIGRSWGTMKNSTKV